MDSETKRRHQASQPQITKAFTLIELLVVVAIIAILVAITLPAMSRARESARKIACGANLKSVGQAIQQYLSEYNNYYPPMAPLPTGELALNPTAPRPPMDWILGKYAGVSLDQKYPGNNFSSTYAAAHPDVFACPSDSIQSPDMLVTMAAEGKKLETYFSWQASSFEPRIGLSVVDSTGYWLLSRENNMIGQNQSTSDIEQLFQDASSIMIVHEYEPFHQGSSSSSGSATAGCNVLFADFHVSAM